MWCQKINVVFWALVLFFSLDSILVAGQNLPIAETKQGLVEGTYDGVSRDGRQFYQFRGIQYAVIAERFSVYELFLKIFSHPMLNPFLRISFYTKTFFLHLKM